MRNKFKREKHILKSIILVIFLIINLPVISAENGIDVVPNLEETPLENITFTTPSEDLSEWILSVSISENYENISTLKLETQICVYDPILCHAPKIIDMNNNTNIWSGSITTLEKHSYVNWRIHIIYEDGTEILVPERSEGYAKVWSTCWEIMEDQKIINGGNNKSDCFSENTNGFPTFLAIISLVLATIVISKYQR